MISTTNSILQELECSVLRHYNRSESEQSFWNVCWITKDTNLLSPKTIYVGNTSALGEPVFHQNAAAFLKNDSCDDTDMPMADAFSCETIIFPAETDMVGIYHQIKKIFLRNEKNREILLKTTRTLLAGKPVPEIMDAASQFLNNPVLASFIPFGGMNSYYSGFDEDTYTLSQQIHSPVLKYSWKLYNNKRDLYEQICQAELDAAKQMTEATYLLHQGTWPVLFSTGHILPECRRISLPVTNGTDTKHFGVITVFEKNRPFQLTDELHLWIFMRILSSKVTDPSYQSELMSSRYMQNLHDLLSGKDVPVEPALRKVLNMEYHQNCIILAINTKEMDIRNKENLRIQILHNLLYSGTCIFYGFYLVIVINMEEDEMISFWEGIYSITDEYGVSAGISEYFSNICNLRHFYQQAKKACEFGRKYMPQHRLIHFEKYKLQILFSQLQHEDDYPLFCTGAIEKLEQYDEKNNAELKTTLLQYLCCGMDRESTCNALNIHRNTLYYRLEKLKQLLGDSFYDGDYLMNLYVTNKFQEFLAKKADCPVTD